MMYSNIHRWFGAAIALLLLVMPVLLADELSLLENWLLTFICWLIIIVIGFVKSPYRYRSNDEPKGQ